MMSDQEKPSPDQEQGQQDKPSLHQRFKREAPREKPIPGKVPSLDEKDLGFGNVPNLRQLDAELERELADAMSGVGDMESLMGGRRYKAPPKPEGPRKGKVMSVRGKDVFIDVGGRILEDCSKEDFFGNPDARQPRTKDFLNKILAH